MIAIAAVLVGVSMLAAWMGGWHATIFGISLSVRSIWRPLIVATALFVAYTLRRRDGTIRVAEVSTNLARVAAGALLVAGVLGWLAYLSPYAGGADSYGYVSASERLRAGRLVQHERLTDVLPAESAGAATPLGYVPAPHVPNATSPAYPLGLPAQMAVASALFGPRAVFYVPFAMGIVLLAVCYRLAFRATRDHTTALAVSAAVALHPVVFAYAIQAMSDVPATAWYVLAGALLMSDRVALAPVAAAAACAALLTRTALLPGVLALALIPAVAGANRIRRAAAFGAVVAIGIAVQVWIQSQLYGHPLGNGYGSSEELFGLRFLGPNVRSYSYWIAMTHGAIWLVAFVRGLFVVRDDSMRALLLAAFVGAIAPYAIYRTYDHWETLRFILPLLVVMTMFAVMGAFQLVTATAPRQVRTWLGLVLVAGMIGTWAIWLEHQNVLGLARTEDRYALAGELVARVTPDNAVILSSLHSGSLRYYAKRQTVDWAKIPPDHLDAAVHALATRGHRVFLMFDGQEERQLFETRHGTVIDRQRWLPAGQRRNIRVYEAPR